MPGISPIKILADVTFLGHGLKLPVSQGEHGWAKGTAKTNAGKDEYANCFKPEDRIAIPTLIPPWFMPQEIPNKYYQDTCDKVGGNWKDFCYAMIDAVQYAHLMWKLQAKFQNLQINAMIALGTPGCLDGPELESFIKMAPTTAAMMGNMAKHRDAVAKGVSTCFKNWQGQVMVPGLPWYPAFVAFPGPMAPPMPNVPMPLITCISAKMSDIITPSAMKSEMDNALDSGMKDKDPSKQYEAAHDAIATVLALAFMIWLASQQVMLVLGKGPIPTFAPPFVPVGPVVMGDNIAIPGHLMT